MNVNIFRKILKLCEKYEVQNCLTPSEFLRENNDEKNEIVLLNFLKYHRHHQILQEITDHFKTYNCITMNLNTMRFKLLFHVLIFAFEPEEMVGIEKIFIVSNKISYTSNVLLYYLEEENQINTARIACKYFENEYVLQNIVSPILKNKDYFARMYQHLLVYQENLHKREPTVPMELNVFKKSVKNPSVPTNTPEEKDSFRSNPIPKTTYHPDLMIQRTLKREYEKNRGKAMVLLEMAKKMPDHGKKFIPKGCEFENVGKVFRSVKIPFKRNVSIKGNLTTVIREAALYAKEKEACIKEIDEILKGGVDTEFIRSMEEEMREEEAKKNVEDMERKKLKCLLSHEEAIIAKCQVKANNKLKYYEVIKEKDELKSQLNYWKMKEMQDYKLKIEKVHETSRKAKESEQKMIQDKQSNARLVQWESKVLLDKAMERKEQELAKKMHIIQEIKAINRVRKIENSKQFDKADCPNLGLLCQMSIAELEERLMLMKIEERREMEEKRLGIMKKREEKIKKIREVREFIEQERCDRVKLKKREVKVLEESEEIKRLKRKIEEAKRIRKACTECSCTPCPFIIAHKPDR